MAYNSLVFVGFCWSLLVWVWLLLFVSLARSNADESIDERGAKASEVSISQSVVMLSIFCCFRLRGFGNVNDKSFMLSESLSEYGGAGISPPSSSVVSSLISGFRSFRLFRLL